MVVSLILKQGFVVAHLYGKGEIGEGPLLTLSGSGNVVNIALEAKLTHVVENCNLYDLLLQACMEMGKLRVFGREFCGCVWIEMHQSEEKKMLFV